MKKNSRDEKINMKLLVVLVVAFFDTTYASKCIGECYDLYDLLLEHEDCDKYCKCIPWEEPIVHSCENGKYFSKILKKCVDPSLVECRNVTLDTTLTPTLPSTIPSTSSPTTEPSTTDPSTTLLPTSSPTTEPSTTVPSTTLLPTTEPSTTSPSTTLPPTTEPSTTEPPTTEPSTTSPSTTLPPTTEPPTTEPPTTEPPTTEPPTTEPPTTEPPTTEPPTTEPPTTEPPTTEPPTTEPSTTVPSTTEPSTTSPSTTLPSTTLPPTTEPPTTELPTTEPPTTLLPTTFPMTEPSITTPPIDENGCIGICPSRNPIDHAELLPNKNCTKFCMCDWGAAKPMSCPAGLFFNNTIQSCDWPFNVNCPNSPNRIEKFKYLASQRTLSKTVNYDNEITDQVDDKEDQEVDGCLGNCPMTNSLDYTVHIPHKNCKKFCKCNWGKKIVINCPVNLHFNNASKVCDFIFNANCTGIGSIEH